MAEQASSIQDDDAFLEACRYGEVSSVRQYLNSGGDANRTTDYGLFALDEASREGHLEIVKLLIDKGASVNLSTQYGFPLKEACMEGHFDVVCELLTSGADVNLKTKCDSALEEACKRNHLKVVQKLIDHGADVNLRTEYSFPLKEACRKGHTDIVKELIKHGADVNMKTKYDSALEAASRNGHYETVCVLLEHKVNVNSSSEYSYALREATRKGHLDIVQKLLDTNAKMDLLPRLSSPVQDAIDIGHFDIVREFIEKKKAINEVSLVDYTNKKITEAADEDEEDFQLLARMYKIIEILTKQTKNEVKQKIEAALQAAPEERKEMYRKCLDHYTKTLNEDSEEETDEEKMLKEVMKSGSEPDYQIRVNFVGHLAAGKTSLMLQMLLEKFNPKDIISTNGLEISTKNCCIDLNSDRWYSEFGVLDDEDSRMHRWKLMGMNLGPKQKPQKYEDKVPVSEVPTEAPEQKPLATKSTQKLLTPKMDEHQETQPTPHQKSKPVEPKNEAQEKQPKVNMPEREDSDRIQSFEEDRVFKEIVRKMKNLKSGRKLNQAFVRGFDYAGQCIFYTVHHLFLSQRGINIIVLDASKTLDEYVEDDDCRQMGGKIKDKTPKDFFKFWAMSLRYSLEVKDEKRIIAVLTHTDLVDDEELLKEKRYEISKMIEALGMQDMFDEKIFCINSNDPDDKELQQLRGRILSLSKSNKRYWGKERPSTWLLLEDKLMEKKSKGTRILTLRDVISLNNESEPSHQLKSKTEILLFLKHHHNLGTILHYPDDGLRELVILDPQWVIDSLKSIITAKRFWAEGYEDAFKNLHKTGILSKELMETIWNRDKEKTFSTFSEKLKRLMEKLDLISTPKAYDQEGKETKPAFYVVPCMLKPAEKKFLKDFRSRTKSKKIPLVFQFHDDFLPPATVYRLLAACIMEYGLPKQNGYVTLFCDAAAIDVGVDHYLILEYKSSCIVVDVVSMTNENADVGICQGVREFLDDTLRFIIAPQEPYMKYTLNVACRSLDDYELVKWGDLLNDPSPCCRKHEGEAPHHIQPEILQHWMVPPRSIRSSFSKKGNPPAEIDQPTHFFLGRLSRRMPSKDHALIFTHLGLQQNTLDSVSFSWWRQEDRQLRLLLHWLQTFENPTYKNIIDAFAGVQINIKEIENLKADEWRRGFLDKDLSKPLKGATEKELGEICKFAGSNYLQLGLELGFQAQDIDRYRTDLMRCTEITKKIINNWIEAQGNQATWGALGDALWEIKSGISFLKTKFTKEK